MNTRYALQLLYVIISCNTLSQSTTDIIYIQMNSQLIIVLLVFLIGITESSIRVANYNIQPSIIYDYQTQKCKSATIWFAIEGEANDIQVSSTGDIILPQHPIADYSYRTPTLNIFPITVYNVSVGSAGTTFTFKNSTIQPNSNTSILITISCIGYNPLQVNSSSYIVLKQTSTRTISFIAPPYNTYSFSSILPVGCLGYTFGADYGSPSAYTFTINPGYQLSCNFSYPFNVTLKGLDGYNFSISLLLFEPGVQYHLPRLLDNGTTTPATAFSKSREYMLFYVQDFDDTIMFIPELKEIEPVYGTKDKACFYSEINSIYTSNATTMSFEYYAFNPVIHRTGPFPNMSISPFYYDSTVSLVYSTLYIYPSEFLFTYQFKALNLNSSAVDSWPILNSMFPVYVYRPLPPYGIKSGSLDNLNMVYPIYVSQGANTTTIAVASKATNNSPSQKQLDNPTTQQTIPLSALYDLNLIPLSNNVAVLRVMVTEGKSCVGLAFTYNHNFYIGSKDLVRFDPVTNISTYEKVLQQDKDLLFAISSEYILKIYYKNGYNSLNQVSGQLMVNYNSTFPNPVTIQLNDFQSFSVKKTFMDVTNIYGENTIWFSLTNSVEVTLNPVIRFKLFDQQYSFMGGYNSDLLMYEIPFRIPPNIFPQDLRYSIIIGNNYYQSTHLALKFGQDKTMIRVQSDFADQVAPLVLDLSSVPIPDLQNGEILAWTMTVFDYPNGLQFAEINVTSDLDYLPRTFYLSQANRIQGDAFNGTYRIAITSDPTTSTVCQKFRISSAKMSDFGGNTGQYPLNSKYSTSVFDFLGVKSNYLEQWPLTNCPPRPIGVISPTLSITSYTSQIDVGDTDKSILVNLTAIDNLYNISKRHCPVVYIESPSLFPGISEKVSVVSQLVDHRGKIAYFTANIKLPYGIGYDDQTLIISAFGAANDALYFGGTDPYEIVRFFNRSRAYLDRLVSPPSQQGGRVTVLGNHLIPVTTILLQIKTDTTTSTLSQSPILGKSNTVLIFSMPPIPNNARQLLLSVGQNSNILIVPLSFGSGGSTNNNKPCPNQCNNNGQCNQDSGECSCYQGWTGPDCSGKIDNTTNTNVNNTQPTTVSQQTTINSTISIVELQELDIQGDIINRYPFSSWNYTLENRTTEERLLHQYNTLLPGRDTSVNVTIEQFSTLFNYSFANDVYEMIPGSIKYSIWMSPYKFNNQLSYLRLIMSTGVTTADECYTSVGVGSNSQSKWIKIRSQDKSLYGKFINKGVVDFRIITVNNIFLTDPKNTSIQLIGIDVPQYQVSVSLDPNFNYLVEADKGEINQECTDTKESKKLTTQQIVGIVVGAGVFVIITFLIVTYLLKRKYRLVRQGKKIVLVPLEKMSNSN